MVIVNECLSPPLHSILNNLSIFVWNEKENIQKYV